MDLWLLQKLPDLIPHQYLSPFLSANTALTKSTADALSVEIGLVKGLDSLENVHVDRAF